MVFFYKAIDQNGKKISGEINAENRISANYKLTQKGIKPYDIKEKKIIKKKKNVKLKRNEQIEQNIHDQIKISKTHVILFTEELGELIESGIQLEPALRLMEQREASPALKNLCKVLRERVTDGEHLSQALSKVSPSFGNLYCNLALAGETSGTLGLILKRQAKYLNDMSELRSKVIFSMIYPMFLLGSGIAVGILFMTYLVPKLAHLIETTGSKLPMSANFLIFISNFFKNWGLLLIIILSIASIIFIFYIKKPENIEWWDKTKLKIPFFGKIINRNFHVQFLQTLSTLINNGVSLDKSLRLVSMSSSNTHHQSIVEKLAIDVEEGASLANSLKQSKSFPASAIDMITIGEQTGKIGNSLVNANIKTEKLLNNEIQKINALAQPIIIISLAIMVGVMAYLMISVIYETIGSLRKH